MTHYKFTDYVDSNEDLCTCLYNSLSVPLHCHDDFYEISIVTSGSFYNDYKGSRTLHKKDALLMFAPGESHSITLAEPNSIHFTFLAAEKFLNRLAGGLLADYKDVLSRPYIAMQLSYLQSGYLTSLADLLVNMSFSNNQQIYNLFLHNACFLLSMNRLYTVSEDMTDNNYIDNLILRLNSYYYTNTDISSIYMDYPIAQCTLTNLFKERTGKTIVSYRNMKRMEYASQLLCNWNYSVTDVANLVNISCLSYFSKLFKAQFGVTPKEYQRLHQKPYQGTRDDI